MPPTQDTGYCIYTYMSGAWVPDGTNCGPNCSCSHPFEPYSDCDLLDLIVKRYRDNKIKTRLTLPPPSQGESFKLPCELDSPTKA